jgi:hypothetical protein
MGFPSFPLKKDGNYFSEVRMFLIRFMISFAVFVLIGVLFSMWFEHFFGLGSMKTLYLWLFIAGVASLFYSTFKGNPS